MDEWLKNRRLELGLTLEEVGDIVGVGKSTVRKWENGMIENMKRDKIALYAKALRVSPLFIMGMPEESSKVLPINIIKIPILGEIACGDPIIAEENIEGYREELVDLLPSGNLFYLKARGNSMNPTIPTGSYVLIREQPEVEEGQIAAVLVNGDAEATLKRVKHQGDMVMLVADNSDYPPYIITEDNPARILGKAIKFSADL
jgi:repressor LexA